MIFIPNNTNNCDILGEGVEDNECDCSQDNLFDIAEDLFAAKELGKLGLFFNEIVENCVNNPKKRKTKGPRSEYHQFLSEKMTGCGKPGAKACSDTMKDAAAEWQELKKEKANQNEQEK